MDTRPTSDRLRETLFNILAPRIEGARFADLFAGSGAVGIEALSRGAGFCWFAENARPAVATIRKNLETLKIAGHFALEDRGVAKLLQTLAQSKELADILFLDPPYTDADAYESTLEALSRQAALLLAPDAVVIAEHSRKHPLLPRYGFLSLTRVLQQGDAALSFYEVATTATD